MRHWRMSSRPWRSINSGEFPSSMTKDAGRHHRAGRCGARRSPERHGTSRARSLAQRMKCLVSNSLLNHAPCRTRNSGQFHGLDWFDDAHLIDCRQGAHPTRRLAGCLPRLPASVETRSWWAPTASECAATSVERAKTVSEIDTCNRTRLSSIAPSQRLRVGLGSGIIANDRGAKGGVSYRGRVKLTVTVTIPS